jgi:hypothetical protein
MSATDAELWSVGDNVAAARGISLLGRGDFLTTACLSQGLVVNAAPLFPETPNHANVVGWPPDKPAQKIIAQELAAQAVWLRKP